MLLAVLASLAVALIPVVVPVSYSKRTCEHQRAGQD
jgi:hypothetical protein